MLRDYQTDIISRVRKSWATGHKRPCIVAPCGSGKTVISAELAKKTTDNNNRVLFLVHRKELCTQTESTFSKYGVNMDLCTVGMVQTLTRRTLDEPKLIIVDENHHVLANSYINILNKHDNAYVVGLTATPQRLGSGGLGKVNDDLIIGPTVSELIGKKHLAPFKYYSHVSADTSKLEVRNGEFVADEINNMMSQEFIYGNTVENYINHRCGKCIVYCSSIKTSTATAAAFREAGIPAAHVDGNTPAKQRDDIMDDFKNGMLAVLCSVDLISEGLDVPNCDSCILLRPTMSLTLHIQQSMRPMRYVEGKTAIIIDQVENYRRHGLPDTAREWTLDYKDKKDPEEMTRTCECCSSVYDMQTVICEPCNWDMRAAKCTECSQEQQYGRGVCDICESESLSIIDVYQKMHQTVQRCRSKAYADGKMQQIKSFTFRNWRNCKSVQELTQIQQAKGYKPGWVWYKSRELGLT